MRDEIITFYSEVLEKDLPEFQDEQFVNDFAFFVDITTHLNKLNLELQGRNQLISDMYHNVASFQTQCVLWIEQLNSHNSIHFKTLNQCKNVEFSKYAEIVSVVNEEFLTRFMDLKHHSAEITLFSHPRLAIPAEVQDPDIQTELIKLKTDP